MTTVRANCTGKLTIRNNDFNGKVGQEGFDQLADLITTPAEYEHSGNLWAMGSQNDGL